MNKIARVVLSLYPKAWRRRYGDEMHAVLDDHKVTAWTVVDLAIRALHAHLFWERRGIWRTQFLVSAAAVSFLCMSTYAGVQQWIRQGANQPQLTMVSNLTEALSTQSSGSNSSNISAGLRLASLLPHAVVDLKQSLAPFVIVYNKAGAPIASTVRLNGRTPELPKGVLSYARQHGRDVLTWQPEADARIAAVVEPISGGAGGYVLGGRALRVVEDQETLALHITGIAWVVFHIAFTIILSLVRRRNRRAPVQS